LRWHSIGLAAKIGNGNTAPAALPPADPSTEIDASIRTIAEGLNAKTWKAARAELLALAGKE
jgi:hypothetical protein